MAAHAAHEWRAARHLLHVRSTGRATPRSMVLLHTEWPYVASTAQRIWSTQPTTARSMVVLNVFNEGCREKQRCRLYALALGHMVHVPIPHAQ